MYLGYNMNQCFSKLSCKEIPDNPEGGMRGLAGLTNLKIARAQKPASSNNYFPSACGLLVSLSDVRNAFEIRT